MLLAALQCLSCVKCCWGWILGAFVLGGWFGMVAIALAVAGRSD